MVRPRRGVPALPPAEEGSGRSGGSAVVVTRIAALLASIESPAAVVGADASVIASNEAWSLHASVPGEAAHPADAGRLRDGIRAVLAGEQPSFEHRHRTGAVHITPIQGLAAPAALVVHAIAPEAAPLELPADGTESRLRAVFDGAGIAIAIVDLKGRAV